MLGLLNPLTVHPGDGVFVPGVRRTHRRRAVPGRAPGTDRLLDPLGVARLRSRRAGRRARGSRLRRRPRRRPPRRHRCRARRRPTGPTPPRREAPGSARPSRSLPSPTSEPGRWTVEEDAVDGAGVVRRGGGDSTARAGSAGPETATDRSRRRVRRAPRRRALTIEGTVSAIVAQPPDPATPRSDRMGCGPMSDGVLVGSTSGPSGSRPWSSTSPVTELATASAATPWVVDGANVEMDARVLARHRPRRRSAAPSARCDHRCWPSGSPASASRECSSIAQGEPTARSSPGTTSAATSIASPPRPRLAAATGMPSRPGRHVFKLARAAPPRLRGRAGSTSPSGWSARWAVTSSPRSASPGAPGSVRPAHRNVVA